MDIETTEIDVNNAPANPVDALVMCEQCDDGDGDCAYPYYGVAPHISTKQFSIINNKETWPENFKEDDDALGCGIYTHCANCGAGK